MSGLRSGDPCINGDCAGVLRVYATRTTSDGAWRKQYLRCSTCGETPGSAAVISASSARPSTPAYSQSAGSGFNGGVVATFTLPEWLTAMDVADAMQTTTETVLLAWERGAIPAPRMLQPLRWHISDLEAR